MADAAPTAAASDSKSLAVGVVTPSPLHFQSSKNGVVAGSPYSAGTHSLNIEKFFSSPQEVKNKVNVVIKGSVQGVFYRKWTVEAAQKQGLNGWVRNLQDGSVEAVFAGSSSAVNDMIQQCHSGPSNAQVASVDVSQWDHEVPQGFEKRKSP